MAIKEKRSKNTVKYSKLSQSNQRVTKDDLDFRSVHCYVYVLFMEPMRGEFY